MSPLPGIPSAPKPPMPAPRKKTSIRTVPKAMQKQFLERLRQLRSDPLAVLPECVGPEPRAIARIRRRLERIHAKGAGFLDRRDKGVVGAVSHALALAERDEVPRMLDMKVGGQRRFFVQRGQVERACSLGVQNHDHPPSLLMAYRALAKSQQLHFFAQPRLWCTGDRPDPPGPWLDALRERSGVDLADRGGHLGCPHDDRPQVVLQLRGGPQMRVCAACGKRAEGFHKLLVARYAGPRQRQPVEVTVRAPDGQELQVAAEPVAAYRAGLETEEELLQKTMASWRPQGRVWMADGRLHTTLEAWLDALGAEPWERTALAAMAGDGFSQPASGVADVLDALADRLDAGVAALLPGTSGRWLATHRSMAVRDILRAAHDEARRRRAMAALPAAPKVGPVGAFLDAVARAQAADGRQAAVAEVRRATESSAVPGLHLWAVLEALGGDLGLQSRIGTQHRQPASGLVPLARDVLSSQGQAYIQALQAYLTESGSGERAT